MQIMLRGPDIYGLKRTAEEIYMHCTNASYGFIQLEPTSEKYVLWVTFDKALQDIAIPAGIEAYETRSWPGSMSRINVIRK